MSNENTKTKTKTKTDAQRIEELEAALRAFVANGRYYGGENCYITVELGRRDAEAHRLAAIALEAD